VAEAFPASLVASGTSIEAALDPVKLFDRVRKGGCEIDGRFTIQPVYLDQPGASRRIPRGASKVASGLGMVVRALPTGSLEASNRQPSGRTSFIIVFDR
jgi:hypothetical protein